VQLGTPALHARHFPGLQSAALSGNLASWPHDMPPAVAAVDSLALLVAASHGGDRLDPLTVRRLVQVMAAGQLPEQRLDYEVRRFMAPAMRRLLSLDPVALLNARPIPVLWLTGERDLQVPPEPNAAALRSGLLPRPAGASVDVVVLPGINHFLQPAITGSLLEYGRIETTIDPDILDRIAVWILAQVRP
jgi:pimeloyl-ACP methyl ester carboxylesterase